MRAAYGALLFASIVLFVLLVLNLSGVFNWFDDKGVGWSPYVQGVLMGASIWGGYIGVHGLAQ
jgi:hypothetical protein